MQVQTTAGGVPGRQAAVRWLAGSFAAIGLLTLAACAQPAAPAPGPELAALQQRLQALEQRVDALERHLWNLPSAPNRSRGEIERNIKSLEAKRAALLERYTPAHPEIREIDLSLRLLKLQLQGMDAGGTNPK
jgi:uncharacterized protein involved in exopolysaccharide biosynthesis